MGSIAGYLFESSEKGLIKPGDLDGIELNFADTKGKVVFVNLWATWCPPCIAEFQTIQDLYNDYNEKVVFLLVSDESPETIKKFLAKKGYEIQIFNPLTDYPDGFDARSIPRTYIIDKEGYIVVDKKGAANWSSDAVRQQLDQRVLKNALIKLQEKSDHIILTSSKNVDSSSKKRNIVSVKFLL